MIPDVRLSSVVLFYTKKKNKKIKDNKNFIYSLSVPDVPVYTCLLYSVPYNNINYGYGCYGLHAFQLICVWWVSWRNLFQCLRLSSLVSSSDSGRVDNKRGGGRATTFSTLPEGSLFTIIDYSLSFSSYPLMSFFDFSFPPFLPSSLPSCSI